MNNTVPNILRSAAQTFDERNRIYGDNYKQFEHVLHGLFPHGIHVRPEAYNQFGIIIQIAAKLTRYCQSLTRREMGHVDSAHDMCVYSAMLEELTTAAQEAQEGDNHV